MARVIKSIEQIPITEQTSPTIIRRPIIIPPKIEERQFEKAKFQFELDPNESCNLQFTFEPRGDIIPTIIYSVEIGDDLFGIDHYLRAQDQSTFQLNFSNRITQKRSVVLSVLIVY